MLLGTSTNNKYVYEKIRSLLPDTYDTMPFPRYDEDIDKTIAKIRKLGNIDDAEKVDKFYKSLIKDESDIYNIETMHNDIALTLIHENLSSHYAIKILRLKGYVLATKVLTLGLPYNHPILKEAIEMVDSLSLNIISNVINPEHISMSAMNMILPFVMDEIIKETKYDSLLGNVSEDIIIQRYIDKNAFSQNQLKVICENTFLSDETREMAFDLLEDIFVIKEMTDHMKRMMYESAADTIFSSHNEKEFIYPDYIKNADIYLNMATCNPNEYLNDALEENLISRCLEKNQINYSAYIVNLIEHTNHSKTINKILSLSTNKMILAKASVKSNSLTSSKIAYDAINSIVNNLLFNREIFMVDMEILKCILDDSSSAMALDTDVLINLLSVCYSDKAKRTLSRNVQFILASNAFISSEIINKIIKESRANDINKLARVNLKIRNINISFEKQHLILQILNSIFNENQKINEYFEEQCSYDEHKMIRVHSGKFYLKPNIISFDKITKSDYDEIIKAISLFNNDVNICETVENIRIYSSFNSLKNELLIAYNDYKRDNSRDLTKHTNKKMVEEFSWIYERIQKIKNAYDYYAFVQDNGQYFIAISNELAKRMRNDDLENSEIQENIANILYSFIHS